MHNSTVFGLDDKPPLPMAFCVALQHLLAVFGGIVTAPLIIALAIGMSVEQTSYFLSSSLVISGFATFIQISRFGPIGSGLLSIQGTSFTFIGPIISAYFMLTEGLQPNEALGIIFGTSAVCAVVVGLLGQCIERIQAVITPNVTGVTVILIGLSLVMTTGKNIHREYSALNESGEQSWIVLALAAGVFLLTLAISRHKRPIVRVFSVTCSLLVGSVVAYFLGLLEFSRLDNLANYFLPSFNRFPLSFDLSLFVVLLPIFIISAVETMGDLTATSKLSGIDLGSANYWKRLRGGISGDAVNTLTASLFCTFPNTSFSQNNGVIRLTGVCSRYVGLIVAAMLFALGVFPLVGGLFIIIPSAVLYGATLLMFLLVFVSGVAIVQSQGARDEKRWWVVGVAVAFGVLASIFLPKASFLPQWFVSIFSFPISTGAVCALLIELGRNIISSEPDRKNTKEIEMSS